MDTLLKTARLIKTNGLVHYKGPLNKNQEERKQQEWLKLLQDEENYRRIQGNWDIGDWESFGREFIMAKLIIAGSEYFDGKRNETTLEFGNDHETYDLLRTLEEFALFGKRGYSEESIVEDLNGDKTIIGFIKDFCDKQFYNFNSLKKRTNIPHNVILALKENYDMIFAKIGRSVLKFIETHPGTWRKVFGDIDDAYKVIYDSQQDRLRVKDEVDKNLLAQNRIQELEHLVDGMNSQRDGLGRKFAQMEKALLDEKLEKGQLRSNLQLLEAEKDKLSQHNSSLLQQWKGVFAKVEVKRQDLERKEEVLKAKHREAKRENQALLAEELARVKEMKNELRQKERGFETVRRGQESKIKTLAERLGKMKTALETGEKGSIIKSADAWAFEQSFANRFKENIKKHIFSKEKRQQFKQAGVKWDNLAEYEYDDSYELLRDGTNFASLSGVPMNQNIIFTLEKKHIIAENEPQMIIVGGVISHIDSYQENGFDNVTVSLSEVVSRLEESLSYAKDTDIPQAFYLASPTGFDSAVKNYFTGGQIGQGFFQNNVVVFLQDLRNPASGAYYNPNDPKAALFVDIFKMSLDVECLTKCCALVDRELGQQSAMTLQDLKGKVPFDALLIKQASNELESRKIIGKDIHKDFETIYYKPKKEE